jgi:hypothetical protein
MLRKSCRLNGVLVYIAGSCYNMNECFFSHYIGSIRCRYCLMFQIFIYVNTPGRNCHGSYFTTLFIFQSVIERKLVNDKIKFSKWLFPLWIILYELLMKLKLSDFINEFPFIWCHYSIKGSWVVLIT